MMSLPLIFMILLMETVAYNAVIMCAVFSQCGPRFVEYIMLLNI